MPSENESIVLKRYIPLGYRRRSRARSDQNLDLPTPFFDYEAELQHIPPDFIHLFRPLKAV